MSLDMGIPGAGIRGGRRLDSTMGWAEISASWSEGNEATAEALERLCFRFWFPLYSYARRNGKTQAEAEHLVRRFLMRFMEKGFPSCPPEDRLCFRRFFLAEFERYLARVAEGGCRESGGEGIDWLSLEMEGAAARYTGESNGQLSARELYDMQWGEAIRSHAFRRLAEEYAREGRSDVFQRLQGHLSGGRPGAGVGEASVALGVTGGAVQEALHRLHTRYLEALRREVKATVASADEAETELVRLGCLEDGGGTGEREATARSNAVKEESAGDDPTDS